jgi:hypothetical protein
MHTVQAEPVIQLSLAESSEISLTKSYGGIKAFFSAILVTASTQVPALCRTMRDTLGAIRRSNG